MSTVRGSVHASRLRLCGTSVVSAGQYLTGHDLFLKRIGAAFVDFVERTQEEVHGKCKEDLVSTTRYISWSLHTRNGFGLKHIIGDVRTPLVPLPW